MVWFLLIGCVDCDPAVDDLCRTPSGDLTEHLFPPTPPPPAPVLEQIRVDPPQADVLFVFDNSDATEEVHLSRMASELPGLFDTLEDAGVDYHVGVALSELTRDQGELAGWIASRERFPQLFREAWPVPGIEAGYGRLTAYRALENRMDGPNAGFRRDDAELHVVFVSGQDDRSVTPDATEFTSWLRLDPDRGGWAHALVPMKRAPQYADYVTATRGQFRDIASESLDYDTMFGPLMPPRLHLSQLPHEPDRIRAQLVLDDGVTIGATVCTPEAYVPDCLLMYESGRNALEWLERPDPAVQTARVVYEPAH